MFKIAFIVKEKIIISRNILVLLSIPAPRLSPTTLHTALLLTFENLDEAVGIIYH